MFYYYSPMEQFEPVPFFTLYLNDINFSFTNLSITFNRISFIFFIFFIIFLIYSIHLIHLGSRIAKIKNTINTEQTSLKLYRADIKDRNLKYLVKTINSIDIGISPSKIIDEKKLLINLQS